MGPFRFSGAKLLFPITYIFGDVFTEVYGYGASRRAIWVGFFASALLAVMGIVAVWLPPAPGWQGQMAFAQVFGFVPRIIVAEPDRLLVRRVCQLLCDGEDEAADQRAVSLDANGRLDGRGSSGGYHHRDVLHSGGSAGRDRSADPGGYIFKVTYEVVATPLTYWVVNSLKRGEGVNYFDRGRISIRSRWGKRVEGLVSEGVSTVRPALRHSHLRGTLLTSGFSPAPARARCRAGSVAAGLEGCGAAMRPRR